MDPRRRRRCCSDHPTRQLRRGGTVRPTIPTTTRVGAPRLPPPAPSLSPEDAAAAEEILASLDTYLEGLVELSKEGVPGGTDETMARLEELPVRGLAFLHLRDDILNANFHEGRATAGTLTWTAEVTESTGSTRLTQP